MKHIYRYLPLSDEVRRRSLYVLAAGSAQVPPGMLYPPSTHPSHHRFQWSQGRVLHEYQILYITRGAGMLQTQTGGIRKISAGDLFILFPNEWHRYRPDPETGWDEHWVAYHGQRAAEFVLEHCASPKDPLFHTDINDLLQREFVRIEEEVSEEAIGYQNVVVARMQLVLALAMVSHQRQKFQTPDVLEVIKRAKALLLEQIDQPVDMEEVAAELHVGYSWLRKMFRQHTGMPPAQYQMQLRLHYACDLLRTTALPISVIGARSGFVSAYYFARVFRSKLDCTPSAYRLQSRGVLCSPSEDSLSEDALRDCIESGKVPP